MTIKLPNRLDLKNTLAFLEQLNKNSEDELIFDWGNVSYAEPFGMLLIASIMRKLPELNPEILISDANLEGNTYLENMGFFKSFDQSYGKSPGELEGNKNYIPIRYLKKKNIFSRSQEAREHFIETIEKEANQIAKLLSQDNVNFSKFLTYPITEIMRNVIEHSEADLIWYSGQHWKSKGIVEVAILDEGIGIYNSLKKNRKLKISSSKDAIKLALEPGISGNVSTIEDENDPYKNTGFGLFMTSRFCREGGNFVIGSGEGIYFFEGSKEFFKEIKYLGTFIRLRFQTKSLEKLINRRAEIVKEGEKIAKENNRKIIQGYSKIKE